MNPIVDFLCLLLAAACDEVLFIAGDDEAEAVVLVDLHDLVGESAVGQVQAVL